MKVEGISKLLVEAWEHAGQVGFCRFGIVDIGLKVSLAWKHKAKA